MRINTNNRNTGAHDVDVGVNVRWPPFDVVNRINTLRASIEWEGEHDDLGRKKGRDKHEIERRLDTDLRLKIHTVHKRFKRNTRTALCIVSSLV